MKIIFIFSIALLLTACVPQSNRLVIGSSEEESSDEPPSFSSDLNFWTNGTTTSYSTITVYDNFNSSLSLRGPQVDNYIRYNNRTTPECFITQYPNSYQHKILAIAAFPSTRIENDSTIEYYYRLEPNNQASNLGFCQTAGLINQMNVTLPGYTIAYSFDSLCSTCTYNEMRGTLSQLYTSSGISISSVNISYLSIDLQVSGSTSGGSSTPGCSNSNFCRGLGYDCCSEQNQCINSGTIKDGVTNHPDYGPSQLAVQENFLNYRDWPSIYNVCPIDVVPVASPTATPDPEVVYDDYFQRLKELYECTTPQEAEMSYCTVRYSNVRQNGLTSFKTLSDDRNFKSTYSGDPMSYGSGITELPDHSIHEIIYAGVYLYKDGAPTGVGSIQINGGNDSIASTDSVELTNLSYTPSTSAPNDDLIIRYKVDGSCVKISDDLAKCYKIYTQGQNLGKIDDHYPSSSDFLIPSYANLAKNLKVEVNDEFTTKWTLQTLGVPFIRFTQSIFDEQKVKITFYVDTSGTLNQVMKAKMQALEEIDSIFNCGGPYCTLEPVITTQNDIDVVTGYNCLYPQNDTTPAPLFQEVYVDSKSVPHRLFDDKGIPKEKIDSSITQEGNAFEYTKDDLLKPNNLTSDIGFNEIYGSFSMETNSAVAAKEIRVESGKSYDIYTNSGNFSSCLNCGTDYYSKLQALFPTNFRYRGGGYQPDSISTNRSELSNSRPYRADDLIFGRACWLPATMIPWTHKDFSDSQYQRLKRLEAQHFLFANGYQRDWFGFDYGALIGSFDGVFWFAIGNKRRVKATTNRLYLAVNAYFGDLTSVGSRFHVTIQDASLNPTLGTEVTTDYDSDGAQCRRYHVCTSDRDCIAQLGWDYTCQTITGVKSLWPKFDTSGNELPEVTDNMTSIFSRIGASAGGTRRCVYRGRGAPCHPDYGSYSGSPESTYAQSSNPAFLGCSSNNYCQEFRTLGSDNAKFNDRISRYGYSVSYVNGMTGSSEHTVGKGAPIIGRPQKFNGDKVVATDIRSNLTNNKVEAICIPGRDFDASNFNESNQNAPDLINLGDQVLGIGMTGYQLTGHPNYISSCSVLGKSGNYVAFDGTFSDIDPLNLPKLQSLAATQVLPANAISIFQTGSADIFGDYKVLDNFQGGQITKPLIQENSCLRAPGSVCHTDMDCAPSDIITKMTSQIDSSSSSYINPYELKFWQEGLVCGQKEPKLVDYKPNPDYYLKNNRCCRETGKNLTIGSQKNGGDIFSTNPTDILGVSINLNDSGRYSRMSTAHSLMTDKASDYPQLRYANTNDSGTSDSILDNQFNTFSYIATQTCCSGSWVRNFHKEENGGGHIWSPEKAQKIDKSIFQCVNWLPCTECPDPTDPGCSSCSNPFNCSHTPTNANNLACMAREISSSESKKIFAFMNSLELLGVPQVKVPSVSFTETLCKSAPDTQQGLSSSVAIPETIVESATTEYTDGTNTYLSAVDSTNFEGELKMRFSADEITCCIPAGEELPTDSSASDCCTGYVNSETGLCALKDYTNVSLYFNRYISSAANGLAESLFDKETGFIKDPEVVIQLACNLNVCRDGTVAKGVAHSKITVPGIEEYTDENRKRMFIDRNDLDCSYSDYFDAGLRWNTDVYCVPEELQNEAGNNSDCNFEVYSCGSLQ